MAGKKLARYVTIDGTTYAPGEEVSADVAKAITNPKAWEPEVNLATAGSANGDDADGDK